MTSDGLSKPYLTSASWILLVVVQAVAGSNPVAQPLRKPRIGACCINPKWRPESSLVLRLFRNAATNHSAVDRSSRLAMLGQPLRGSRQPQGSLFPRDFVQHPPRKA